MSEERKLDDLVMILTAISKGEKDSNGYGWSPKWCGDAAAELTRLRTELAERDAEVEGLRAIEAAAKSLLDDVRRRYSESFDNDPGNFTCTFMRRLHNALAARKEQQ